MWFSDNPALLQREFAALEEAGIGYALDEGLLSTRQIVRVTAKVPIAGTVHEFVATYPDNFPYFKPFVTGPDLGYRHHVNPTTGEYCFLETGLGAWGASDTLAWLLTEQLEKVVAANAANAADGSDDISVEVAQAEPFSAYLQARRHDEVVIVDSALVPGDATGGWADLAYTSGDEPGAPLRGHLFALWDRDGRQLAAVEPPTRDLRLSQIGEVRMTWVQLADQPLETNPRAWWSAAEGAFADVGRARQGVPGKPRNINARALQIVLVGFPEETGHRTPGQGWVALVRQRENAKKPWGAPRFVRVERAGHQDLYTREPRLAGMSRARIAVLGLGGLGSHLVPLLGCMAPNKLVLIDGDFVSAATAIRNPSAFAMTGRSKVEIAMKVVHDTQPYTFLQAQVCRIGAPRMARDSKAAKDEDQTASIEQIVQGVDVVIDLTADLSVQHYVSDLAHRDGVAYVRAEALPGVRAGLVALQRPGAEVCWMCWQHHLGSTIDPLPEFEPPGGVQPPGCPDPTYTGAGFDLAALAAQTAQVVAAYVTGPDGYGSLSADLMTVKFVDESGQPTPPAWESHHLTRHPDCTNHDGRYRPTRVPSNGSAEAAL